MMKLSISAVVLASFAGLASADAPKDAKKDAMPDMTPPAELAAWAKTMAGSWKCTGTAMGMDGKSQNLTATLTSKTEMNGWWIHDSFDAKMGAMPFHFEQYTTLDPKTKKLHTNMLMGMGGWSTGDAPAPTGGKTDFELVNHDMMGDSPFKDHVDLSDPKVMKAKGEFSMDKGKTWQTAYDMSCKK